ncbi:GNAT family N-acetyltransferase [Brevibacillus sp. HB1.3]|uniref:GNAT family N-acetyltransferase n=1 Tax=Brevibacillus sp. HB1.3 TaxID=2738842 RepID=UPI0015533928|nr:GNAT family N-acetyltransferase [Brevibacillus sp. HB1.3]NQF12844.1 GNAT family N-acetyltransferase [Brevibacillus sp. HB1.3]
MDWYDRLNEYFPEYEMKKEGQIQALIRETDIYHKVDTDKFLLLYAEFPTFIFIDYLLINPATRGQGIGTKVIQTLKKRGKDIILEVEPIDRNDEDSIKRVHFYQKNGFVKADRIQYSWEEENGETYEMKIYYWSPHDDLPQEVVLGNMSKACQEIHNFRAHQYYGRNIANPDEVLHWKH